MINFDKFKQDFMDFLRTSNVNLGRLHTKTRKDFLKIANDMFDAFASNDSIDKEESPPPPSPSNPMGKSVMRIKPSDPNKALNVGKGVHAMTSSESMRADEQLGRSPYGKGQTKQEGE